MSNVAQLAAAALSETDGLLRLAPTWVPRSFLQPGRRLKLHPHDYYALGTHRGGIDERWFASTTEAANENRNHDEGLSYCVHGKEKFLLRDAVAELGAELVGDHIWPTSLAWAAFWCMWCGIGPMLSKNFEYTGQRLYLFQIESPMTSAPSSATASRSVNFSLPKTT